jgi:NAD(P)-dependent dehydrogenase (short-subunit alcohol dehydrogenase family)
MTARGPEAVGKLADRVAVVTGGGSGIGEASAKCLAAHGAAVSVVDISEDNAVRVAAAITSRGGRALAIHADVSDEAQWLAIIGRTMDEWGRLDVLHNNAALVRHDIFVRDGTVGEMDVEVWEAIMAVNLRGPMLGTKHAVPAMIASGGGSIINMSSGSSRLGDTERSAYGASKAGVNALTLYTATQYGREGIRANAILPGLVLTPAAAGNLPDEFRKVIESNVLTPYVGEPDDVANLVAFLASDESRYITGQLIPINGGMSSHQPTLAQRRALQDLKDEQ